jgi:RNA polymerase sigma-70 factor, ECF subfamily
MKILKDESIADVSLWFQQKVVENHRLFFSIASQILRNPHEVEDAVQEAVLKAWGKLGELQEPAAVVGWIARITRHVALDRKKRRMPDLAGQTTLEQVRAPGKTNFPDIDDTDDRAAIVRELNALPDAQAVVLTLRFFEELDIDEIAARLELTENNVRVRLHRAIEGLRRRPALRELLRD